MKINKILPYIIFKVENITELEKTQILLFDKGYKWINVPLLDNDFIYLLSTQFPIYISNLPYVMDKKDDIILNRRIRFNEFNNNIIFYSVIKYDFNLNILRINKLLELNYYEN